MFVGRNCVKNNYECGGYEDRVPWQSGRLAQRRALSKPTPRVASSFSLLTKGSGHQDVVLNVPQMPPRHPWIFRGLYLESDVDLVFLEHFESKMSGLLTLMDQHDSNPFTTILIPMAVNHEGLMHSMLALSGSHLSRCDPQAAYLERKQMHFNAAISALTKEVTYLTARGEAFSDPLVACMIFQCLIPISDGSTRGDHLSHLQAARTVIKPRNDAFGRFAWEFYKYHDMSHAMTSLERAVPLDGDGDPVVVAGLDGADGTDPTSPVLPLSAGGASDPGGAGGPDFATLGDTIPPPSEGVMIGVCDGLFHYIDRVTALRDRIRARKRRGAQPTVAYGSIRDASVLGKALLEWRSGHAEHSAKWVTAELYREAALVYLHRSLRASRPDPDLSARVDCGVLYLCALPGDNSVQSILLLPTFVLGCAAFEPAQRAGIEAAFDKLAAYSFFGNIDRAREVVHQVWGMMDAHDEASWDWETIMRDMGYNFLVT